MGGGDGVHLETPSPLGILSPESSQRIILFKRGRFLESQGAQGLNFFLQSFDHLLILAEVFFQLKMPVEITETADQDPQENRAKNH